MGDESCTQWTTLFLEETKNKATGGLCATASQRAAAELAYQKKAEQISDDNLFKLIIVSIQLVSFYPLKIYFLFYLCFIYHIN